MTEDQADIVNAGDARPAGKAGECFYCNEPVGQPHDGECVIPRRIVRVRVTIDYERSVPKSWNKSQIEFHLNESSWCADNAFEEISAQAEEAGCLCKLASFEYMGEVGEKAP